MRRSVRFLLERRHSELMVSEAVDGVDAIEKAKETKPDLILLDLAMPRLNGAEAASVLKNTLPETPIILKPAECVPAAPRASRPWMLASEECRPEQRIFELKKVLRPEWHFRTTSDLFLQRSPKTEIRQMFWS